MATALSSITRCLPLQPYRRHRDGRGALLRLSATKLWPPSPLSMPNRPIASNSSVKLRMP